MHRPTRIGFPFVGDTIGGSHISCLGLIRNLPKDVVEPHILIHREGRLGEYLSSIGQAYRLIPGLPIVEGGSIPMQIAGMISAAPAVFRFLRRASIDVVHTNDTRMHLSWALGARMAGSRFVWHQRSANESRRHGYYSKLASRIVVPSRYCAERLPEGMRSRADIIYDPFETGAKTPDRTHAREMLCGEIGISPGDRVVGFVGNLTRQKRPLVFVEMARHLQQSRCAPVYCLLFGERREQLSAALTAKITDYGLERVCRLMGPRHPIEPWIAACDVLAAPAVAEGLGRALVEAMLVGTPVVAADDAGHREVVLEKDLGCLVRPEDGKAFADAVEALLVDPGLRERIAARARECVAWRFAEAKHVAAMLRVFGLQSAGSSNQAH